ncbi:MAG: hypothetical protein ACREPB_05750 [Arenimonas sp.]
MENTKEQTLLRCVVLGLGALAVVKLWQSARHFFWTAFGIGWVLFWTGGGPFF